MRWGAGTKTDGRGTWACWWNGLKESPRKDGLTPQSAPPSALSAGLVVGVATTATLLPAWGAGRFDQAATLRDDQDHCSSDGTNFKTSTLSIGENAFTHFPPMWSTR